MTLPTSAPKTFNFETHDVRTFDKNGEAWFAAKDVCEALGISNSRHAMTRLDEDEKDGVVINDAMSREQTINVVNESGLYALILTSRKPEAQRFKRWITHEVLPAIRTTGTYVDPGAVAQFAASQLTDTRWLVTFGENGPSMQPVPFSARIVDMKSERSVTGFITDEVPLDMVERMMAAGHKRLFDTIRSLKTIVPRSLPQNS